MSRRSRYIALYIILGPTPFEEEREVGFEEFYPMTLGEVINEKYKVVAKVHSNPTAWKSTSRDEARGAASRQNRMLLFICGSAQGLL
jgi:hypothetical protein